MQAFNPTSPIFFYYKQIVPCKVQTTVHFTKIHTAYVHNDEGEYFQVPMLWVYQGEVCL